LPQALPKSQLPLGIVTLENRTLSPTAELFIACAREVTKAAAEGQEKAKPKRAGSGGRRGGRHE